MVASSRTSYVDLLSVVLVKRNVQTVFQPIVDVHNGSVLGYEALSRPDGFAPTASIEGLFDAARRTGYLAELDLLCRRAAIRRAAKLPPGSLLFLNICSGMLLKPTHGLSHLLMLLAKAGRSPDSTVLEISEREHIRDLERLMNVVEEYRREGLRFAVDDLGEGHTTFELMAASGAEFLKLGRTLTASATRPDATAAIRAAVTYAKATHAQVIAEGIENDRARDQVARLGIGFGQGFSLGEPSPVEDVEHVVTGIVLRPRTRLAAPRPAS
jgi:EAL domain-containing protein (putative c-di-GMP-specific phosphodiesterase class I)